MSADALIDEIGRRLADATPARTRVVLLGSRARGENGAGSDVDVLVIEPTLEDPMQESVRLRRALRGLGVPIDILVIAQDEADRRSVVRGTVVERALREDGRSLTPEAEESRRMLTAARSDLRAARVLAADDQQTGDVIGFHAQQAVEKAIKAVLVASGIAIPYTHDLGFLLDILAEHTISVPGSYLAIIDRHKPALITEQHPAP